MSRTAQWAAHETAPSNWNVHQLRTFLRYVAPERYKALQDKRRRAPLEALAQDVIDNHEPSLQLQGKLSDRTGTHG